MKRLLYIAILLLSIPTAELNAQCNAKFTYSFYGLNVQFTDSSSITVGNNRYMWFFGDGDTSTLQNPSHSYQSPGTYIVQLFISSTGCSSTFTDTITVSSVCNADFTYNSNSQNVVSFSNQSFPLDSSSFFWDFGDNSFSSAKNPIHTYSSSGPYTVSLTVYTDRGDTCFFSDTIYVNFCNANFAATVNGFTGHATFSNYSSASNHTLYNWNFGDGSGTVINSKSNVSHTYINSGTYTVSLSLYDSLSGCNNTYTDNIVIILPDCEAAFNYQTNQDTLFIQNTAMNFDSLSYNFGDGTSSNQINPSHVYQQSGTYIVCQTVFDSRSSCSDTFCDTIFINAPPPCRAGFNYSQNQDTVFFQSSATNFDSVLYNFGDGTSSSQQNPLHIYQQSGTYVVCQTVFNSSTSCSSTFCDTTNVIIPDKCSANFTTQISGDSLFIQNNASNFTSVLYDFGDGTSSSQQNPLHIYQQSGTYVVCQTITNLTTGCQDSKCDTISILIPQCQAGFNYQKVGDSMYFQSTATNFTNIIYYFGDGDSSTQINPIHQYSQSGAYNVKQIINDSNRNCTDTVSITIIVTISTSCVAAFQAAIDTTNPNTLYLINNSSDVNTHQYLWDFGDGSMATGRTPNHFYQNYGSYPICLTVSDPNLGCTNTYCDTLGLDSNGNITTKSSGFFLKVLDGSVIGIKEAKDQQLNQVTLFPNPCKNYLNVEFLSPIEKTAFNIYNLEGKVIKEGELTKSVEQLNLSELKKGLYFLRLTHKDKSVVKKFIKE